MGPASLIDGTIWNAVNQSASDSRTKISEQVASGNAIVKGMGSLASVLSYVGQGFAMYGQLEAVLVPVRVVGLPGHARVIAPRSVGKIDMSWKNLPTEARKAVNDVMTEFGSGPEGARKLLGQVRAGARPKPSTISDGTLRVYRDFVQKKYDELSKLRQDKNIDVMRDRLEIYRISLGD